MKEQPLSIKNLDKFILLIAKRFDKSQWYALPQYARKVFYDNKDISKWLVRSSIVDKMFFLEAIGYTTAICVFPDNKCNISDIPELSNFTFDVSSKESTTERMLEKELFAITTREVGALFYNMGQNSTSKYFGIKQDYKALEEANENFKKQNFKSATQYQENYDTREAILKFISNILIEFSNQTGEIGLHQIAILNHLRANSETGVKANTIHSLFKGSIGFRMSQKHLAYLYNKGYITRTGKKEQTVYLLTAKGLLYINNYAEHILSL